MSVTILQGHALAKLRELPDCSVQCCVTSPPYWGLRSYSTDPQVWGGNPRCDHQWATEHYYREGGASGSSKDAFHAPGPENAERLKETRWREDCRCQWCGAWRGELGAEPTIQLYIEHIVSVFREVRRVLRNDGTLWLNIGDCYASSGGTGHQGKHGQRHNRRHTQRTLLSRVSESSNIKPKDLCMIPARVAIALQDDGWYLRSDIIWSKPNPMPESVTDRPTKAHEYLFLLSKSERYFYDADAIREPDGGTDHSRKVVEAIDGSEGFLAAHSGIRTSEGRNGKGRNKRSVWTVATQPYAEAHFATYPPDLIKPCILCGTKVGDTILDPFAGSGTTGMVAIDLARKAILIELNPKYIPLIKQRCDVTPGLPL